MTSKGKVLFAEEAHPVLVEELTNNGFECVLSFGLSPEELKDRIPEYVGLIVRSKIRVDAELIDAAKNLKFVGRTGSGMELIDVAYAESKGIKCINSPEGNKDAVAEYVVGAIITLLHCLGKGERALRQSVWARKENTGWELMHRTVGIIGFGNTGQAVAQRLKPFGCQVLAYDKLRPIPEMEGVQRSSLETIFEKADVVSLHIPLNDETHYFVDEAFINSFEHNFYLINSSRGGVLNTLAVIDGVHSGKIKGVALDVFEEEDLTAFTEKEWEWMRELQSLDNVLITPHIAGVTQESFYKVALVLSRKINDFF